MGIFWVVIVLGGDFLGGNCPDGILPGGSFPSMFLNAAEYQGYSFYHF